jgi:hypothetical protein
MKPPVPIMLDAVEIDALRIGLALLDDEVQGGTMSPTPAITNSEDRHGKVRARCGTFAENRKAALYLKSQRLAIARLSRKLRAVA